MLDVTRDGPVLRVRLNRPEVRNAFNRELIDTLRDCFSGVKSDDGTRVLVLSGEGPVFCAGADLNWMRAAAGWSETQHLEDAERLFDMLAALEACAVPTIARVQGAALGGGMGLTAACDIAIAAEGTQFGFTEAKLGLLPAAISPFCVASIGPSHSRALFATAERFDAARALQIGLVHRVVPADQLDAAVQKGIAEVLSSAPGAAAGARQLATRVAGQPLAAVREEVTRLNAARRASEEGREGMSAFLEKRKPRWIEPRSE